MKNLLILTDYNKDFLISLNKKNKYTTMDVNVLKEKFTERGFVVKVLEFSEVDLKADYCGYYVIYQTSETIGQFYKKYIEDVVYLLKCRGAIVLPDYSYLKAHHNKGYMEAIRNMFKDDDLKSITSKYYGSAIEALKCEPNLPVVIKQISGSGSAGVYCAKTKEEYEKFVKLASNTIISDSYKSIHITFVKNTIKKILSFITNISYKRQPIKVERPIIVQSFIQGLLGDYKVLYFGGKYYTLYRKNRKNDFRASGGGLLYEVPMEDNIRLLNFAKKVVAEIEFPIIGMDIGFDGDKYHLIEFQMIHVGPYTLQNSNYYFTWDSEQWKCIREKSDLEEEFSRSIAEYIIGE